MRIFFDCELTPEEIQSMNELNRNQHFGTNPDNFEDKKDWN